MKNNKIPRMNDTTKSSAEIVASVDDLLIEILLRLPIKSLVHFELVSKHWLSIINNPQFRRWRNPFTNSAAGMFFPSASKDEYGMFLTDATEDDFVFEYVPFFPPTTQHLPSPSGIRILNSCNGLLICETPTKDYLVYNPTTDKYSDALPKLDGRNIRGMTLAFDPAKSPHHYKVVCVHQLIERTLASRYQYQLEIYSNEETPAVWRSSVVGPFIGYLDLSNGVYWNGAIHWIRVGGGDYSMYFNVDQQVLEQMPNPPASGRNRYFGESCDHLHYIQIYDNEIQFNIYEMKRDYSEWFVKYRVDLSPVVSANPRIIPPDLHLTRGYAYAFSLLSLVRGDQEEADASFLVLQIPGAAIRYNIVPKTFEKLHDFGVVDKPYDFIRVKCINGYQYIESLCSV